MVTITHTIAGKITATLQNHVAHISLEILILPCIKSSVLEHSNNARIEKEQHLFKRDMIKHEKLGLK